MKFFGVLVLFMASFLSIAPNYSSLGSVALQGTAKATTVDFSITNNGSKSVILSYIVIQDNVLMLEEPNVVIPPGGVVDKSVSRILNASSVSKLIVTEVSSSGGNWPAKAYVVITN